MRTYRNNSGTYSEKDLAVVIWLNAATKQHHGARALQTMTSSESRYPMAFPLSSLKSRRDWKESRIAKNMEDVIAHMGDATRQTPLIVPLDVAQAALGWEEFHIPTEYTDN